MTYRPIIGLEVHVELATNSKMFCGCPADHFGVTPNTHTCPVCLGLPGALPVPNKKAVEWTILLGLALGAKINKESKFDRKNYFYPDLPKGYQISQYDQPLCIGGRLQLQESSSLEAKSQNSKVKNIRIRRVHLEEDTGKLQHAEVDGHTLPSGLRGASEKVSLVDFNRCGVPLVEIVTEPDFRSVEEVDIFLKKLQRVIRYLGISGADMEKGSMRIEPSISISPLEQHLQGLSLQKLPNYRVELKNINSFRFARKALEYEIKRQTEILERGEDVKQQTRGWNEARNETVPQREKEEANDYRYFPEPDIPPMVFTSDQVSAIGDQIPELPDAKSTRFVKEYGITEYAVGILTEDKTTADFFEQAVKDAANVDIRDIANWMVNKKVDISNIVPAQLIEQILKAQRTMVVSEKDLDTMIKKVLTENPKAAKDLESGNPNVFGYIVGKVRQELPEVDPKFILERMKTYGK